MLMQFFRVTVLVFAALGIAACDGGDGERHPVPAASGLSPSTATAEGPAFTLTVKGSRFVSKSEVHWNGSPRTTTFVSSTELRAAINAADIADGGTAAVTVYNRPPGGGTSSILDFMVVVPSPVVQLVPSQPAVLPGHVVTLTWTTRFAASCAASGGWSGARAPSGTETVGPLRVDSSFAIECTGPSGTGQAQTLIRIGIPIYQATELGSLGGPATFASHINEAGQVVGASETASQFLPPFYVSNAFLYTDGTMTGLGTFGGIDSSAYGVNDLGQVVGSADRFPPMKGGSFPPPTPHAFLFSDGKMTDLGLLVSADPLATSHAHGINNAGQVVGCARDLCPFLYSAGVMTALMPSGVVQLDPRDINDAGQVVGQVSDVAALWSGGELLILGTLGGPSSHVAAINSSGQIVGYSYTAASTIDKPVMHAFVYRDGQMIDLGTLGGSDSNALGINDAGAVVGFADTPENLEHAFLYSGGKMFDLNTCLAEPNGVVLSRAEDINNHGQMVAISWDSRKSYVLSPTGGVCVQH